MHDLNIKLVELSNGEYTIEFFDSGKLVHSAHIYFDVESDFFNKENIEVFYDCIEEFLIGKTLNAENCYHALNRSACECSFCKIIETTFGYTPTLLNRYSDN